MQQDLSSNQARTLTFQIHVFNLITICVNGEGKHRHEICTTQPL